MCLYVFFHDLFSLQLESDILSIRGSLVNAENDFYINILLYFALRMKNMFKKIYNFKCCKGI